MYFWNRTLHVSDSFSVHHQEPSTVHTAVGMSYRLCWLLFSRIRMEHHDPASQQTVSLMDRETVRNV